MDGYTSLLPSTLQPSHTIGGTTTVALRAAGLPHVATPPLAIRGAVSLSGEDYYNTHVTMGPMMKRHIWK